MDVRDSSMKRKYAILEDLADNLREARKVLTTGYELPELKVLDELVYQIDLKLSGTEKGVLQDPQEITEFIRMRINPTITSLGSQHKSMRDIVAAYQEQVNQESGIFVSNRNSYEKALSLVNMAMMEFVQEKESSSLRRYPCFVDTFQTDGLEYNIYLGQEVTPSIHFEELHLEEIRLLQLEWTIECMKLVQSLQTQIGVLLNCLERKDGASCELQIAPLIMAYGDTLTLKFRMNEKRLDVDGSYNVRYEIMKKRIDKATVNETGERLTQPGYIAIVYSRNSDALAYIQHLQYLEARHGVEYPYEDVVLNEMPGIEGLRALRFKVFS